MKPTHPRQSLQSGGFAKRERNVGQARSGGEPVSSGGSNFYELLFHSPIYIGGIRHKGRHPPGELA